MSNRGPKGRKLLIDKLLNSEGYAHNWFIYWADALRAKTRIVGGNGNDGIPFIMHLKETLAENKPYDDWVHDMLAATGRSLGERKWSGWLLLQRCRNGPGQHVQHRPCFSWNKSRVCPMS